jgi:hypothetical protein
LNFCILREKHMRGSPRVFWCAAAADTSFFRPSVFAHQKGCPGSWK